MKRLCPLLLLAILSLSPVALQPAAYAQQMGTDDAALAEHRACDVEGWIGAESWFMPACHFIPGVEILPGIGLVDGNGGRQLHFELQAKAVFSSVEEHGWGIGLVGGVGPLPADRLTRNDERDGSIYAYVPLGVALADGSVLLHQNVGIAYERHVERHHDHIHVHEHYPVLWGFRGDVAVTERFTVLGEFVGEDLERPDYQFGVRTEVIPDRLNLKLTYAGSTDPDAGNVGLLLGFAWASPPLF